jgi:ATP-dependent Clp protease protease subunit
MPIGVPRVPHRLPGESTSQWLDIYNKLYRERTLFLGEEIDDELANQLVGILLFLNTEDSTRRLFLYINSPGGSVLGGFAIFDAIHHVIAPTTTICFGVAASMASFILNGGEKGQRIALPHSRTMIHQPRCGLVGQAAEVQYEFEEADRLHDKIIEIYAKQTGQTPETIAEDLDRDFFMTATETKEYGLVDQVTVQMK